MTQGLNINHAAILDRAQRRSDTLRQLEALFQEGGHASLSELKRALNWMQKVYKIYLELDAEGKELMPHKVKTFLQGRYHSQIETIIDGNGENIPGLEAAMSLFPETPHVDSLGKESTFEEEPKYTQQNPLEPHCTSHKQYYNIRITFEPSWDDQAWPNGAWKAQYVGEAAYGIGATPDAAFHNLHEQS